MITVDDLINAASDELIIHIRESNKYPIVLTCDGKYHTLVYSFDGEIKFKTQHAICQYDYHEESSYEKWDD